MVCTLRRDLDPARMVGSWDAKKTHGRLTNETIFSVRHRRNDRGRSWRLLWPPSKGRRR